MDKIVFNDSGTNEYLILLISKINGAIKNHDCNRQIMIFFLRVYFDFFPFSFSSTFIAKSC